MIEEGPPQTLGAARRIVRVEVAEVAVDEAGRLLARWPLHRDGRAFQVGHEAGRDVNRVLAAEVRKLARPLIWGSGLSVVVFCLLITWAGAANAHGARVSPRVPGECVPALGPACARLVAQADAAALAAARDTSCSAQPGQVGRLAAGMLASLPGRLRDRAHVVV